MTVSSSYCAVDFGTSNSAIAIPDGRGAHRLAELEPGFSTMPTAVFYAADGQPHEKSKCEFGRAAVAAGAIDALYFTGGSTGLKLLADRLRAAFSSARPVRGDRFASVVTGLALHAGRRFGAHA